MADIGSTVYLRNDFLPYEQATLSIASAPVLYGLSVYSVMPVFWEAKSRQLYMFRLFDHFIRLQNSAKIMAFDDFIKDWNYDKFLATIEGLLKKNHVQQDSLVRICVFVDDTLKGTRMHGLRHSLSAFVYARPPTQPKNGSRLCVSSWRRTPDNAIPSRAKINGSYVNAALMKHEAVLNGFDDAIALNEQGHVTESTVANVFLIRGKRLMTASDSSDLLEGITRDSIFRLAESLDITHEKRSIDRSELYLADEMFLCGSSAQITPIIEIDHRPIGLGKPGPITKQLQAAYDSVGRQRIKVFANWTTAVG